MSRAKTKVVPHVFVTDPSVPPDQKGRGACVRCHLVGEAGYAHHDMPAAVPDAQSRAAGDNDLVHRSSAPENRNN